MRFGSVGHSFFIYYRNAINITKRPADSKKNILNVLKTTEDTNFSSVNWSEHLCNMEVNGNYNDGQNKKL